MKCLIVIIFRTIDCKLTLTVASECQDFFLTLAKFKTYEFREHSEFLSSTLFPLHSFFIPLTYKSRSFLTILL